MGTKQHSTKKHTTKRKAPLVALTPHEVRHLVKPRPGFDAFAEDLFSLYASNPSVFGTDVDVEAARKALATYNDLRPQELAAQAVVDQVHETRLLNSSTVWSAMLAIYGHGALAGRTNATIDRGIAPFAAFMKNGPRKQKATATPPSTPTTTVTT
jgi:hypothetical protein